MNRVRLSELADYVLEKEKCRGLTSGFYIGVDNMLPDHAGVRPSDYPPEEGVNVTIFKPGDILIGNIRPYFKKIWLANCPGCCSADVLVLRPKTGVDSGFLFSALSDDAFFSYVMKGAKGTQMPRGDKVHIMNYPVAQPNNQRAISELILSLDAAILDNQSICVDLEATAKLLYDYWFVQFDFPDEDGKPYKSSGGKMVWNDELKCEIPAGWSCVQLDEIASLINNTVNPSSGTDYLHFSIPAFDEGRTPSLENGGDIESNKFSLPDKCILVSKLNPQFQRVWLVFDERVNKISSTEFLPFVPKKACSYELLYEILRSDAFYAYMCNCSSSSTGSRKRMPPELCLEYKIAFPKEDSDLSERFRAATVSILSHLAKIPGESKRLTELRDFLLPLLMNGQVTIGDDGK